MLADVVAPLRAEARETDERRLLVLAGSPEPTRISAAEALAVADIPSSETKLVGPVDALACERLPAERAGELLGTTHAAVVLDCHESCRPNTIGRAVGAVDGGGLLVLLTPPLADWPERRDAFDETFATPPADVEDVSGAFRTRLVETLRTHRGIAIVDVDTGTVECDGLTDPAPRYATDATAAADTTEMAAATETTAATETAAATTDHPVPDDHRFPGQIYRACRTDDQIEAVAAMGELLAASAPDGTESDRHRADENDGHETDENDPRQARAVVLESDRGRGKSSAAGLATAGLALAGRDVLVVAPRYRNAAEVFARARERLREADALVSTDDQDRPRTLATDAGAIRFLRATDATTLPGDPDVVVVDEAAALPVSVLSSFLDASAVAFATTIHGYEGAGRGFSVRFREQLDASDHAVTTVSLSTPIRYAAGDPVEVWAFNALLLDARPPVADLVADATPDSVTYDRLDTAALLADEHLLREVFGLLVLAHYRTEPDDLARLLDAPNVAVRALRHDGHVVSVALLAREGGLSAEMRQRMYDGERVRGNMLPDVLTTQLRDEDAGVPVGQRVLRIATHPAVRSRGLGSRLLAEIRAEFAADVDWLGVGYGATPDLLRFWAANGYAPVHLATTRNDTSGEYSVLMLDPTSDAGRALHDRHARQFLDRIGPGLADPLADLDPDVVRETLAAVDATPTLDLPDWAWRQVASAAFGPGLFDMAPGPFREIALRALVDDATGGNDATAGNGATGGNDATAGNDTASDAGTVLTDRQQRLLVLKALQGHTWDDVADRLDFHSTAQCMRALGDAYEPLVDRYGTDAALTEADRYR